MELMLGNKAVARGAYEAGVRVATAYPGTPSTEITEFIANYDEIYTEWSPNEKIALEVAIGASIAGGRYCVNETYRPQRRGRSPIYRILYRGKWDW